VNFSRKAKIKGKKKKKRRKKEEREYPLLILERTLKNWWLSAFTFPGRAGRPEEERKRESRQCKGASPVHARRLL